MASLADPPGALAEKAEFHELPKSNIRVDSIKIRVDSC
jgi:hypothetical protein